ncbi:MAG: plasmid pRiA4b ORF-3 family protein, partial [Bifidobacteriaceae bacterium]|nr:plasmid pRiA4b ORF-3 family protein [Bifidobacteriaceae bacterium]
MPETAAAPSPPPDDHIVRLRVELVGAEPEVWRLFEVPASASLGDLHRVLQCVLGWTDSHLHAFTESEPYGQPGQPRGRRWEDLTFGLDLFEGAEALEDERATTVGEIFGPGRGPLHYEYDFGDSWWHRLEWIEDLRVKPAADWPGRVERGSGRCPLEDSGGVNGWARVVAAVADRHDQEHQAMRLWASEAIGPDGLIHPEEFDREAAQSALDRLGTLTAFERARDRAHAAGDPTTLLDHLMGTLTWGQQGLAMGWFGVGGDFLAEAADGGVDYLARVPAETVEQMTRGYRWLAENAQGRGLRLTQAGRLPPALVREAWVALGGRDDLAKPRWREDDCPPVAALRFSAQSLGLVRKVHGMLALTRKGAQAAADPQALLRFLVRGFAARRRSLTDQDAAAWVAFGLSHLDECPSDEFWRQVGRGLWLSGWLMARDHGAPTA